MPLKDTVTVGQIRAANDALQHAIQSAIDKYVEKLGAAPAAIKIESTRHSNMDHMEDFVLWRVTVVRPDL